jgi:hypothetical protein
MKNFNVLLFYFCLFFVSAGIAQNAYDQEVFMDEPINFNGISGDDKNVQRYQAGRIVYKKVEVPDFPNGTDVIITLKVRSNGDRWDKSGSCFVVSHPEQISIIDVAKGEKSFPASSTVKEKYGGVKAGDNYEPVVELLRFMTPFGVGYFSNNSDKHRKPVYIPKWEDEVVWQRDISHLLTLVDNTFYVGVWIDSWTAEGYKIDLSLSYSNRANKILKVKPLVNTISYVDGQALPDFFPETELVQDFKFSKKVKNVKLHYITTGHGGHSGGDEFIKIKNALWINNKMVLDTMPWRDDCASFRRFNPSSGVWLKKDSAAYIDFEARKYKVKEIEERIASSDISRSNWCPGSAVDPIVVDLGDMEAGSHTLKIGIGATKAEEDKFNHWLVSAYLTYEE